jgi:hypothetical protein
VFDFLKHESSEHRQAGKSPAGTVRNFSGNATFQALTSPRVDVRKALALDSAQIGECVYLTTDRFLKIHGFTKAITRFLPRRN